MTKPRGYWNDPANIDTAFDDLVETLRRVPTSKELQKKYGGALRSIENGKYHPEVKGWNDYLRFWGFKLKYNPEKWEDPKIIDAAFDEMVETLRRVPTKDELVMKYGGLLHSISEGKYHPELKTFNDYLRFWGFKVGHDMSKWKSPESIDAAFDEMVETLRRVPTQEELGKKYRGALDKIRNGRYHPKVKGWNDYLRFWGFKINHNMGKGGRILRKLLEDKK